MKNEVVLHTKSVDETMALGRFLGTAAVNDEFIALSGDLGAGKTHFRRYREPDIHDHELLRGRASPEAL